MAISPQELEQLESFKDGTLSKAEANELEIKLEKDPQFLAEAQAHLRLIHNLQQADPDHQRAKRLISSSKSASQTSRIRILQPLLLLAATIALLIVVLQLIFSSKENTSSKPIAVVDYNMTISSLGLSADSISNAELEFRNGKYRKAAELYNQEYQKDNNNKLLLYNYGIACFKGKNYPEAINAFREVAESNDNLNEDAQFYLAYSYYKDHQIAMSKKILEEIIQIGDHLKIKDAKDLKKKIADE